MRPFFPVVLSLLVLAGCQEKAAPLRLSAEQESISMNSAGGAVKLAFTATQSWTASVDVPWCQVIPNSGNGSPLKADLRIFCEENTGHEERSCQITFRSGGLTESVSLTQHHKDGIVLDSNEYNLSDQAQTLAIRIWKTGPVTAEVDPACQKWLAITGTKSMDSQDLTLSVARNTSASREGKLYLRYDTGIETVVIRQAPSDISLSNPDLKVWLLHLFDKDNDGCLSIDETRNVTSLQMYQPFSPEDLQYFPEVTSMTVSTLKETSLDLRPLKKLQNLIVYCPKTRDIDLSGNDDLRSVVVEYSEGITDLSLSGKKELTSLRLEKLSNLARIDLSGCIRLDSLEITSCKNLESLDLRSCKALSDLEIHDSVFLKSLDVDGLSSLKSVLIENLHSLKSLDISGCTSLTKLTCWAAGIEQATFAGNSNLTQLELSGTQLTGIDLGSFPALESFISNSGFLSSISAGNNPALTRIFLANNDLETFDLSGCPALEELTFNNARLKHADFSGFKALKSIELWQAGLESVTFGTCPALTSINLSQNLLRSLEIKDLPSLESIGAWDNQLNALSVSGCPNLSHLELGQNQLETLDLRNYSTLTMLSCRANRLTKLDTSPCKNLQTLYCDENLLTELDLTANYNLNTLQCYDNPSLKVIYLIKGHYYQFLRYDYDTVTIEYR